MKSKSAGNARGFQPVDYLKITILGFAMSALWQSMHTIILPLRLLDFVPEAEKNTYLGMLTFTGLLLAMFVQPIAGAFSDRSDSRWGRRRPYILIGGILALLILPGVGLAGGARGVGSGAALLGLRHAGLAEVLLGQDVGGDLRPAGGDRHGFLPEHQPAVGIADLRNPGLESQALVGAPSR
jgi:MFS family permease